MNNQTFQFFEKRNRNFVSHWEWMHPSYKCVPISFKLSMKHFKGVFFTLLVCIAIISLNGCRNHFKIAMETWDASEGIEAVKKVKYQGNIELLAQNANTSQVREIAVKKVTNNDILKYIATGYRESDDQVRLAAIDRLTDQTILAEIAIADKLNMSLAALEKVTDQFLLAKIASKVGYWDVNPISKIAIAKLTDPTFMKIIDALKSVPIEHRPRIMAAILPAIRVLSEPEVINIVGEIISIKTYWSSKSQTYCVVGSSGIRGYPEMPGERFKCTIELKNQTSPLSYTWQTSFPESTMSYWFRPAEINAGDLLVPVFERLSHDFLINKAYNDDDWEIRWAVVETVTDTAMLTEKAVKDRDEHVREAAVNKLTDQTLLAKIAVEDEHGSVQEAAQKRLDALSHAGRK
jgi:hypothetical protein